MIEIRHGDCIDEMRTMDDACVDAIVTDPPYELGFMGKGWDATGIANSVEMWREACRVLKPGGHLLAFSGTRTYHRMVCAIEDAGFEIRDQIGWLYGTGFPKSLDVSKAIDKAAGAERAVIGPGSRHGGGKDIRGGKLHAASDAQDDGYGCGAITAPATSEAQQWAGWGTALKPCWEPVVVARKPLAEKTVAANVLKYGTGAINIDASRVPSVTGQLPIDGDAWEEDQSLCASCAEGAAKKPRRGQRATGASSVTKPVVASLSAKAGISLADTSKLDTGCSDGMRAAGSDISSSTAVYGKTLTDQFLTDTLSTTSTSAKPTTDLRTCTSCSAAIISSTISESTSAEKTTLLHGEKPPEPTESANGKTLSGLSNSAFEASKRTDAPGPQGRFPGNLIHDGSDCVLEAFAAFGDKGGHSGGVRKAGHSIGNGNTHGHFVGKEDRAYTKFDELGTAARFFYSAKASAKDRAGSKHPTVKNLSLMRYLCKLVTPPGGTVLDMFAGSGTTLQAAMEEGFSAIGIEQSAEYVNDIRNRIGAAREGLGLFAVAAE